MTLPSSIQASFNDQTSISRSFHVQKGTLNKYRFRQAVLNEHVETSRSIQAKVESGVLVGQIFKASQDNINGIFATLESAAGAVFDDFEYANDGALQAEWVETDANDKAVLSTTIFSEGTKSMELPLDATVSDEWINTIVSADYTGYTFSLDFYQTVQFSLGKVEFFIGDGANTKSIELAVQDQNAFFHFDIDEAVMSEDGGTTDVSAITKIGFRLTDTHPNATCYVDNMVFTPQPGTLLAKLYDMGSTIPVDAVTKLSDGTQYTQLGDLGLNGGVVVSEVPITLLGGNREYFITKFAAGCALEIPTNELLTPDNFYAIVFEYEDTDVNIFGSNPAYATSYYNNGFAFTAASESAAISAIGPYNDLQFGIFSTQDVHLNTLVKSYDAAPGTNARENIKIEDKDMKVEGIIVQNSRPPQNITAEFKDRTYWFPKGGKFEVYHGDDFTDSTSSVDITIGYICKPPAVNG